MPLIEIVSLIGLTLTILTFVGVHFRWIIKLAENVEDAHKAIAANREHVKSEVARMREERREDQLRWADQRHEDQKVAYESRQEVSSQLQSLGKKLDDLQRYLMDKK